MFVDTCNVLLKPSACECKHTAVVFAAMRCTWGLHVVLGGWKGQHVEGSKQTVLGQFSPAGKTSKGNGPASQTVVHPCTKL